MDTTPQTNAILQEIIDHHEIKKMLAVYCHGCDRGDGPRMQSVYGMDSWDNHGQYNGPGREYPDLVMNNFAASGTKCIHLLGQSQIKVTGNRAGAETYFLASVLVPGENGGKNVVTLLSGRYCDTLVKEGGQWKIDKRICVRDYSITLDIEKDRLDDNGFVQGVLSGDDPSYAVLGLIHPGLKFKEGLAELRS
jgi:hypothetical protein